MSLLSELRGKNVFSPARIEHDRTISVENRGASRMYDIREAIDREEGVKRPDGGVIFEPLAVSPYFMPIDRRSYHPESRFGPIGTCPLCNNVRHAEFDAALARSVGKIPAKGLFGFPRRVVSEHVACHMGPIYAKEGLKACSLAGIPDAEVRAEVESAVGRAIRAACRSERDDGDDDVIIKILSNDDCGEPLPVMPKMERQKKGAEEGPPGQGKVDRGSGYAYDGNKQLGRPRPWGDDRVEREVAKRDSEAIIFYDEMLDARRMARQIYSDIMDSDIDALNAEKADEKGGKYVERNYSAAIAAVREIRSIATDMAKLALIATKYSDGKEARRVLSPVMQGMIDEIGVFDAGDESLGEPDIEEADAELVE